MMTDANRAWITECYLKDFDWTATEYDDEIYIVSRGEEAECAVRFGETRAEVIDLSKTGEIPDNLREMFDDYKLFDDCGHTRQWLNELVIRVGYLANYIGCELKFGIEEDDE